MTTRVLMVCLGNICRSPMAQGALELAAARAGLDVAVDSAGIGGWHTGDAPDPRAIAAASRRGASILGQRARQVSPEDFHAFDLILGMEPRHLRSLEDVAPRTAIARLGLLLDYAPDLRATGVPDPYYDGPEAFDRALDLIEAGVEGLIAEIAPRG